MRKIQLFLCFIVSSFIGLSQQNEVESMQACSECIRYSVLMFEPFEADRCQKVIDAYPKTTGANVAGLILGRNKMEEGDFKQAIAILEKSIGGDPILQILTLGLLGDCHSELQEYKKALSYYDQAGTTIDFKHLAPRNLFKAYEVATKLELKQKAQAYIAMIDNYYFDYGRQLMIDKYVDPTINFKPIVLNRKISSIADYPNAEAGVVNGTLISNDQYLQAVAETQKVAVTTDSRSAREIDNDFVWHMMTQEIIFGNVYANLHLTTTEDEIYDFIVGKNGYVVGQDVALAFTDPQTGNFDSNLLEQRIRLLRNSQNPSERNTWEETKVYYEKRCKRFQLDAILEQGIYITNLSAENEIHEQKDQYEISYDTEFIRNSDAIPFEPKDIEAYFERNKDNPSYRIDSRLKKFHLISVKSEPSAADSLQFYADLDLLKQKFASSLNDSLFVMRHSDEKSFNSQIIYLPASKSRLSFDYPDHMDASFQAAKKGDVLGPYFHNDSETLAKVIEKGPLMTARHILIEAPRGDANAMAVAKEKTLRLMEIVNSENFEDLVKKHSDDKTSIAKGGIYADFPEGMMIPEFSNFARDEPIHSIGYIQTIYGFHIIEVLDRKENASVKLAVVQKKFEANTNSNPDSDRRAQEILNQLKDRTSSATNAVERDQIIEDFIAENNFKNNGFLLFENNPNFELVRHLEEVPDDLARFCLRTTLTEGEFIDRPIFSKGNYLIPIYSSRNEPDQPHLPTSIDQVIIDYQKEQKAEEIILENRNPNYDTREVVTLANARIDRIPSPKILAAISRSSEGTVLNPMHSVSKVFWIKVGKKTIAEITQNDIESTKEHMEASEKTHVQTTLDWVLKERANVIDNRMRFQLHVED